MADSSLQTSDAKEIPFVELVSARWHLLVTLALLFWPAWKLWAISRSYTSHSTDSVVTTVVLFLGSAWHLWRFARVYEVKCTAWTWFAWLGYALLAWQLAWIPASDFWFIRLSLLAIPVLWAISWWGPQGVLYGWRVIAAAFLWTLNCDGSYSHGPSWLVQPLSEITAQFAGRLMLLFGQKVTVSGVSLIVGSESVSVGGPCTAIPLVTLLMVLLGIVGLLLRLRLRSLVVIAGLSILITFLISVVRVIILAKLLPRPDLFEYWHFGEGGAVFSAVAMLAMGYLLMQSAPCLPPLSGEGILLVKLPSAVRLAWVPILFASLLSLGVDKLRPTEIPPGLVDIKIDLRGVNRVFDEQLNWKIDTAFEVNRMESVRHLAYADPVNRGGLEGWIGYVPVLLTGNPIEFPDAGRLFKLNQPWNRIEAEGLGVFQEAEIKQNFLRVALISSEGIYFVDRDYWANNLSKKSKDLRRWRDWWLHKAPLIDKRAYFVAVIWIGSREKRELAFQQVFKRWRDCLISK